MSTRIENWVKPALILIFLAVLTWLAPVKPLDPWNLLSPKTITIMIFALATIQAFGSLMTKFLGARDGAILTGFFGGLISSTATTASLAKSSKNSGGQGSAEILIFLSATGAMLFEALVLVVIGTTKIHLSHLLVFSGPILATTVMIFIHYRSYTERRNASASSEFKILPILKLSLFIIAILSISKLFQQLFGQNGLLVLTSLVSLFEVHGSIIANVQLHESEAVSTQLLCSLLAASVVASYLSKLFLIATLGSASLRTQAIKSTLFLFFALGISWAAAIAMN